MWTWTIDLRPGTVTEAQLDDRAVEFPRIDDRLVTLPARYSVSVAGAGLIRHDLVPAPPRSTASAPRAPREGRERPCSYPPTAQPTRAAAGYLGLRLRRARGDGSDS